MKDELRILKEVERSIRKAGSIAISGHINPDGDSLGSLLALGLGLESMGKRVYMLCRDELPALYRSLPGANRIKKKIKEKVDLAIAVDCSTAELLGDNVSVFKDARAVLEIDHHEYRLPFGDINFIDHKAAAVGEMAYKVLKGLKVRITADIAVNILTSIIVETNLFKLSNVRSFTFKICAELLETGVKFSKLVDTVYLPKTREAAILSAICLSRARFLRKGRLIWSVIKKSDFTKVKGKDYDVDAVATEMRSIKGVKIAVLFREKDDKVLRVSLRSKDSINVGRIAKHYNGGGHFDIAGCYLPNNKRSMDELLSLTAKCV